jgi:hypothetical protein
VDGVADQQYRALRVTDQPDRLGDLPLARTLVDETITAGRQGICYLEFFEDDMGGVLDVAGPGGAGQRTSNGLADDLVGLVGVLD